MKVIGIDPGYAIVGYAIVDVEKNRRKLLKYGTIETSPKIEFPDRICKIYNEMNDVLKNFTPDFASIESLLFQNNQKTAIKVAEARGVIILSLKNFGVKIFELTPLQLKCSLTGYGKATKQQIILMTKKILNLKETIKPDDAADACALALSGSLFINNVN